MKHEINRYASYTWVFPLVNKPPMLFTVHNKTSIYFKCLTWTRKNNCSKKLKKKSATVLLMCEDKLKENFKWHRLTATQVRPLHNMQTTFCKQILLILYLLFPDGQTCSHFIVPIFDSLTLLPLWISLKISNHRTLQSWILNGKEGCTQEGHAYK